MKPSIVKTALIALVLTLSADLSLAADSKNAAANAAKVSAKPVPAASAPKIKLVDINSAKKDELKTLPGVGDEVADKIIAGRPYLSKAHLLTRKIIDAGAYESLRIQVIAKQKNSSAPKSTQK